VGNEPQVVPPIYNDSGREGNTISSHHEPPSWVNKQEPLADKPPSVELIPRPLDSKIRGAVETQTMTFQSVLTNISKLSNSKIGIIYKPLKSENKLRSRTNGTGPRTNETGHVKHSRKMSNVTSLVSRNELNSGRRGIVNSFDRVVGPGVLPLSELPKLLQNKAGLFGDDNSQDLQLWRTEQERQIIDERRRIVEEKRQLMEDKIKFVLVVVLLEVI